MERKKKGEREKVEKEGVWDSGDGTRVCDQSICIMRNPWEKGEFLSSCNHVNVSKKKKKKKNVTSFVPVNIN